MARTKQLAVKREASSEYFNKKTASWEAPTEEEVKGATGDGATAAEGAVVEHVRRDPGLLQLIIAVVGIYSSL